MASGIDGFMALHIELTVEVNMSVRPSLNTIQGFISLHSIFERSGSRAVEGGDFA